MLGYNGLKFIILRKLIIFLFFQNGMYLVGGSVGFYAGDIRRLSDDMKALRPTVTPAVPRLLNRMYDKVNNEVGNSFIKRVLLNMALSAKENEIKRFVFISFNLYLFNIMLLCNYEHYRVYQPTLISHIYCF